MLVRKLYIFLLVLTGQYYQLWERAVAWEVGQFGFVLEEDKRLARQNGVQPINDFERWVLQPTIQREKQFRRDCLDEAERIVLGE